MGKDDMESIILAGDIGATKTVLALYDSSRVVSNSIEDGLLAESTLRNTDFPSFSKALSAFLAKQQAQPEQACFGVAGPIQDNKVNMTNLDWNLNGADLAAEFGMKEVLLVNDLVATASGALHLPQENLVALNPGKVVKNASVGVLAVGTGLGQSFVPPMPMGQRRQAFPTEGGHSSFAPRNQEQIELLQYLLSPLEEEPQPPHVSVEQVCSGMALPALYAFQLTRCQEPEWMREKRLDAEPAALTPLIVEAANAALDGTPCEPALRAVQLLLDILAAEAANLALKVLATGGIFLGGGMVPRLLAHIDAKHFMEIFSRGVYREMLGDIPVHIIMEPKTALLGARQLALKP
ncbi:MAG: glucokinase [Candidatus Electrothrix aestuarii]|uniref:Glucokinase n=1 Tax=Candidatus Electrothrix aestuarii TaxID=3062594 RepID=A0AAU8LSU5_9BACT|nr:glucokinase [Candidatus Electrothrix aestuarii]